MENDKYFYTVYYKGEDESPLESGNYKLYWWYEKCYFLQTDSGDIQHFVVSQAQLQYRRAILLDEVIEVRIDKVKLKPASIIFYQSIHSRLCALDLCTSLIILSFRLY